MPLVYVFGEGKADGNATMSAELGGKGANLAEMTNLGIPVPPGFTTSTKLCTTYIVEKRLPQQLEDEVRAAMARLEQFTGKSFGGTERPMLVSVRSGAKISMPGMMDTILNLGLNPDTAEALARESGNRQFVFDSYRRFVQMYGNVVFGIKGAADGRDPFEEALEALKHDRKCERDIDLAAADLESLVETFKDIVKRETGRPFPDDPWAQLWGAIEAVYGSWNSRRAVDTDACTAFRTTWVPQST